MSAIRMKKSINLPPQGTEENINHRLEYIMETDDRDSYQVQFTVTIYGIDYYLIDIVAKYGEFEMRLVRKGDEKYHDPNVVTLRCLRRHAEQILENIENFVGF